MLTRAIKWIKSIPGKLRNLDFEYGTFLHGKKVCPQCKGMGTIIQRDNSNFAVLIHPAMVRCNACRGRGYVVNDA